MDIIVKKRKKENKQICQAIEKNSKGETDLTKRKQKENKKTIGTPVIRHMPP